MKISKMQLMKEVEGINYEQGQSIVVRESMVDVEAATKKIHLNESISKMQKKIIDECALINPLRTVQSLQAEDYYTIEN